MQERKADIGLSGYMAFGRHSVAPAGHSMLPVHCSLLPSPLCQGCSPLKLAVLRPGTPWYSGPPLVSATCRRTLYSRQRPTWSQAKPSQVKPSQVNLRKHRPLSAGVLFFLPPPSPLNITPSTQVLHLPRIDPPTLLPCRAQCFPHVQPEFPARK